MKSGTDIHFNIDVTDRVFSQDGKTFVSLCVVNKTVNLKKKRQTFSTEMLHWDDYCAQHAVNVDKPSMSKLFGSRVSYSQLADSFEINTKTYVPRSIVLHPTLCGRKRQIFCTEMQHWDDVRSSVGDETVPKKASMTQLFAPPLERKYSEYNLISATLLHYCAQTVAARQVGAPSQPFCCEMLHWDEYQRDKLGVEPNPSMKSIFGT